MYTGLDTGPDVKNLTQFTSLSMMEFRFSSTHPLYAYELLQTGVIFTGLVSGIICIINLVFLTGPRCKNFDLLFTSLAVGFLHLISCVLILKASLDSAMNELPRAGNQHCIDYFVPSTIANTIVLVTIALGVINGNVTSCARRLLCKAFFLGTICVGVYILYKDIITGDGTLHQEVFMTFDAKDNSQVNFFWSVCLKKIYDIRFRLLAEYCFIYAPVLTVILVAWKTSHGKTKDWSLMRLKVMASDCVESEDDCDDTDEDLESPVTNHSSLQIRCFCSRLNAAFVAVLVYSFIVLFVLRPAMIVYGYLTYGNIRDILPSLLETVIYCFLCSEFLLGTYRHRMYRMKKQLLSATLQIKV